MNNEPEIHYYFIGYVKPFFEKIYIDGFTGRWYIFENNLFIKKLFVECYKYKKKLFSRKRYKDIFWLEDKDLKKEKIYPVQNCKE